MAQSFFSFAEYIHTISIYPLMRAYDKFEACAECEDTESWLEARYRLYLRSGINNLCPSCKSNFATIVLNNGYLDPVETKEMLEERDSIKQLAGYLDGIE